MKKPKSITIRISHAAFRALVEMKILSKKDGSILKHRNLSRFIDDLIVVHQNAILNRDPDYASEINAQRIQEKEEHLRALEDELEELASRQRMLNAREKRENHNH